MLAPDDLADPTKPVERYFERTAGNRYGLLCSLPHAPLYLPTPLGGEVPPGSTLRVKIAIPLGGTDPWDEVISLVHSNDSAENGDHYAVETDERQRSVLRFGNGINGRSSPGRRFRYLRIPDRPGSGRECRRRYADQLRDHRTPGSATD